MCVFCILYVAEELVRVELAYWKQWVQVFGRFFRKISVDFLKAAFLINDDDLVMTLLVWHAINVFEKHHSIF